MTVDEDSGSRFVSANVYAIRKKASNDLWIEMDFSALERASSRWPESNKSHPSYISLSCTELVWFLANRKQRIAAF
jgi:hypothetical protein